LADSAGLSARYLGSIERAAVAASVTVLGRLAQALDVDASELIRPLAPVGENGRVFLPEDNPLALVGEIISESAEFSHPGTLRGFTRNPQRVLTEARDPDTAIYIAISTMYVFAVLFLVACQRFQ
jgi:transcriptional regulator with XRE-family HTH domain